MPTVSSTSFGLVIAFVLPGFACLLSLAWWSSTLRDILGTFSTSRSNVGLFLLVFIGVLLTGMLTSGVRWLVFECWLLKDWSLEGADFGRLSAADGTLIAFRAAVDEHYRYHQFWGGIFVVLPISFVGWLTYYSPNLGALKIAIGCVLAMLGWGLTFLGGKQSFFRYSDRARAILKGVSG